MTVSVDDPQVLHRIFVDTEALLLDFDGPVCSVFAGFPAHIVADQLRDILTADGTAELPPDVRETADPFDVLRFASELGSDEARHVEAAFRAHEVEAVQSASPTPGAHDLVRAWKDSGRPLAIVSNNAQSAVETYLDLHEIRHHFDHISARTSHDVSLLKPNSYLVRQAVDALAVQAKDCTLIGDSATDIQASHEAGVMVIGFANKPAKVEEFVRYAPTAVCTSLVPGRDLL